MQKDLAVRLVRALENFALPRGGFTAGTPRGGVGINAFTLPIFLSNR
jgi:hypothetical protein